MERRTSSSPGHSRQRSAGSIAAVTAASTGMSTIKRTQNVAAKAAAARLARVMATQTADEDEDDDDEIFPVRNGSATPRYAPPPKPVSGSNSAAAPLRASRSPSPALGRNFVEFTPSIRSTSAGRSSSVSVRSTTLVPPSRTSVRTPSPIPPMDLADRNREKRLTIDGVRSSREAGNNGKASELRDELEMLQEENEHILDKLHIAEEKSAEAQARAQELEKQVAALGEGVSLEARLLSRKEAALRQREATLKVAAQSKGGRDGELSALRLELDAVKNEATATIEKLREAETESKSLRLMTQRMILTQEEMEEVVLKRCWLARYWGLAIRYGVYPDIAVSKHEYWASLAPLPFEVVISAGHKAKEEPCYGDRQSVHEINDITGEGNIESMLSAEKGLHELASLKVEDAVVLAMAHSRRPNFVQQFSPDLKSSGDSKHMEAFELSQEEKEDVLFKQSWLAYFWRRAAAHGVEEDIAEERLQFWIGRSCQTPSWHDVVDVERGLVELRKLGIEHQLWEALRKELDQSSSTATLDRGEQT